MPKKRLTAPMIEKMVAPASGQVDVFDAGYPGLAVRVGKGGAKTFVFFYRLDGRQRRLTFGRFPSTTLASAHEKWREARERLERGEDPAIPIIDPEAKEDPVDAFAQIADEWLKRDQSGNRSYGEVKRIIERDVKPKWNDKLITDIHRRDVVELLDGIEDRGARTLRDRTHAHLHRLFRWCVGRGIVELNPMSDLEKSGPPVKRTRVLSDDELRTLWKVTERRGWPFGPIIQLLILTGARREEIRELRWNEVDLEAREIRLEGNRTKNGEPHTIPLSDEATAIITALPRIMVKGRNRDLPSEYVFTTTGRTPVSGFSKAKEDLSRDMLEAIRKEAEERGDDPDEVQMEPWRFHDLRRTLATGMQRLGIGLQVVESVLGHISGSRAGIVGIYQRHSYRDEKRLALDAWSRFITTTLKDGPPTNVITLGRPAG